MNIIFISNKSVRAKNFTLTGTHIIFIATFLLLVILSLTLVLNFVAQRYADRIETPMLRAILVSPQEERHQKIQSHLQDNLNVMATKLGHMQAQLLRLDALGERLAESSGIKSKDLSFHQIPGQGGAYSHLPSEELSFNDFNHRLQELSSMLDERADKLGALDSILRQGRLSKIIIPSAMPIDIDWFSSGYGYRIDPLSGKRTFHEGVDFSADIGTPIKAAASGVVVYSDRHPEYGNMIEIDHGGEMISRYAHASRRLVQLGQVVLQGQKIAEVGNTGRSTGAHLHFEIRHKDKPLNPSRFLKKPS